MARSAECGGRVSVGLLGAAWVAIALAAGCGDSAGTARMDGRDEPQGQDASMTMDRPDASGTDNGPDASTSDDASVDEIVTNAPDLFPSPNSAASRDAVGGPESGDFVVLGSNYFTQTGILNVPSHPNLGADGAVRIASNGPARITVLESSTGERIDQFSVCGSQALFRQALLQADEQGNTYFAEWTETDRQDAIGAPIDEYTLGRVATDGKTLWTKAPDAAPLDFSIVPLDLVVRDGFVYLFGAAAGVLPDQAEGGKLFVAKYDAAGKMSWIRQVPSDHHIGTVQLTATVGADGSSYIESTLSWYRIASDGKLQWQGEAEVEGLSAHQGDDAVYMVGGERGPLLKYDAAHNAFAWKREVQTNEWATAAVTDMDGIEWFGRPAFVRVEATRDFLVLYGTYATGYHAEGAQSTMTASSETVFVARVNLDGTGVWFKQFLYDRSAQPIAGSETRHYRASNAALGVFGIDSVGQNADGDIVVVGTRNESDGRGVLLFTLAADDGAVLPSGTRSVTNTDADGTLETCPAKP